VTRPPATATTEPSRLAAEYYVQRSGVSWTYQLAKGRSRWTVTAFADWKVSFAFAEGKKSGSGIWRMKDGVWLERNTMRGETESVLMPAVMTRGTRWTGPTSVERSGRDISQYEVLALDASVPMPTGGNVDHCLAVLETGENGGGSFTHYYAPSVGRVAVLGPDGEWVMRLVEFNSGSKGHTE
jgi:hypothetical protein